MEVAVQLTVRVSFTYGTTQDLPESVSWTFAPVSVASVGPDGLATGTAVGSAVVTATQDAVSGSMTVAVTAATLTTIAVTPANPSIAKDAEVRSERDLHLQPWYYPELIGQAELDLLHCQVLKGWCVRCSGHNQLLLAQVIVGLRFKLCECDRDCLPGREMVMGILMEINQSVSNSECQPQVRVLS